MSELTPEKVKEFLDYNPDTGEFRWKVNRYQAKAGDLAGYKAKSGYIMVRVGGRYYGAHRLAWFVTHGEWPNPETDHINGIRDDNRLCNLRPVTNMENQQNRAAARVDSKTGLMGVSLSNNGRQWLAQIQHDRKVYSLGRFDTQQEAHAAYLAAKRLLHKGFPHWRAMKKPASSKSGASE